MKCEVKVVVISLNVEEFHIDISPSILSLAAAWANNHNSLHLEFGGAFYKCISQMVNCHRRNHDWVCKRDTGNPNVLVPRTEGVQFSRLFRKRSRMDHGEIEDMES